MSEGSWKVTQWGPGLQPFVRVVLMHFGPSRPKCRSASRLRYVTVALLSLVVSFPHEVLRQLEQIRGTKPRTAIQCFRIFLTGDRIIRDQRSRGLGPGEW